MVLPGVQGALEPISFVLGGSIRVRVDPTGDSEQRELQNSQCSVLVSQQ